MQIFLVRLGGRSIINIPTPTPSGLARLKMMVETRKFLKFNEDWAMLRPRLKAMTVLWTMTAMTIEKNCPELSWRPMATPSKTEWKERAKRSITLLREE